MARLLLTIILAIAAWESASYIASHTADRAAAIVEKLEGRR